jgi:hypothetical protein
LALCAHSSAGQFAYIPYRGILSKTLQEKFEKRLIL